MLRQVRSTSWRDPGHVRWRGSAHRIRVVAVDGSISSLLLKWSGLRRRRPGAGFMKASLVSATIFKDSTLDLISWRYDESSEIVFQVSTALMFERAAIIECPGCPSHQTVGSRVRERAITTWCVVEGNVPPTERVLEGAITTWCVVERNVRTNSTCEICSLSRTCRGTKSLAVGPRRNTARDLRARWRRSRARLRAARRKRNLKTVSHIVLQSTHKLDYLFVVEALPMAHLSDLSKSLVETCQPGFDATRNVALVLLGQRASRREWTRMSRIARTVALAPMAAALAGYLAAEIAELDAAGAFDVVTSFGELDGARAVRAELELGATLVGLEHLLLVFFLGLAGFLATMVDDTANVFKLRAAVEAAEALTGGV
jgi:hypothetical protein